MLRKKDKLSSIIIDNEREIRTKPIINPTEQRNEVNNNEQSKNE